MTITTRTTTASAPDVARELSPGECSVETVVDSAAHAEWARYVEHSPHASVFHHPCWSDAVCAAFGHRPHHYLARCDERIVGVLPLVEVRSRLAGRLLISVPYGNYGGIVADSAAAIEALAATAAELAVKCGARVLELRSAAAQVPDFEPIEGYVGFVRDLPLHPNEMDTFLPRKARAAARHARERDGLVIQHDAALAPVVWQLYCRSMRRLASINYPYRLFAELFERMGERAWATVAWQGERPIAGTISLVFRDTVMPYIVGTDERVRSEGATNLLYWAVAERAVRSGLRRFDFGRSRADNHGSVSFKKNQGFEPRPLGYQRYVPPGRTPANLKPSNPRFALARRVWPRLPLPMTRALGACLARWIPG